MKIKNDRSDKIIRVRSIIYSQEDIEDFRIQINELIQMNLIRESKSPHSSPAFMVRNGYYIPNKEILINLVNEKIITVNLIANLDFGK